ncbi:hypothetical protein ACFB49_00100 [Sphingomonas sp. DBB INV C78]|uniref:ribosome modulation factor n=1 Tax=Sphingomonas sp. DBB INV C78 TaxID=3349434 RepID=UPI0036D2711E
MSRLSDAYLEGVNPMGQGIDDHAHGVPRDDCPYSPDSAEAKAWLQGWDHGEQAESGEAT